MILAEVEFLQEGAQAQHKEQAADPQQQARLPKDKIPPIFVMSSVVPVYISSILLKSLMRIEQVLFGAVKMLVGV